MNEKQITKIVIKGFKSIESCELDFQMINILIGSNGSGKSNFISLFKILQSMIDGNLQLYTAQHGGSNAFLFFGSKRTQKLTVEFYFGTNGYQFELIPTMNNGLMYSGEWFYWNQCGKKQVGSGHMESLWRKGTGTRIDSFVKSILENQRWRVYHFHDTSDSALVKQVCGINDNYELATDARNLAAFLYRLRITEEGNYRQIVRTIRMVAPYFKDFVLHPNPFKADTIYLEWSDINSDIPFTVAQLSDGTLRFICLATLLLQPEKLMPETILIDEPELGLHPYAISVLAALIKKVSVKKQIIISTQSVELLNEFSANDIIVVNHTKNHSEFKRLNEEELQVWIDEDYTMGELWKGNIIGGRP
ncbi:MAG: AAA family ATPase [Lachnospiraceae bacterium]|nr:AAA family ATPase [Lachnospiraceae bacterium]